MSRDANACTCPVLFFSSHNCFDNDNARKTLATLLTAKELDRVLLSVKRGRHYGGRHYGSDDRCNQTVIELDLVHAGRPDGHAREEKQRPKRKS